MLEVEEPGERLAVLFNLGFADPGLLRRLLLDAHTHPASLRIALELEVRIRFLEPRLEDGYRNPTLGAGQVKLLE